MMDIKNLSREEREALKAQLAAEEAQEKNRIDSERETYKVMVDVTTREVFNELAKVSEQLATAKAKVFDAYKAIIDMKQELRAGNDLDLSRELEEGIRDAILDKKQSILFLNRRGNSRCGGAHQQNGPYFFHGRLVD